MQKALTAVLVSALLSGCAMFRKNKQPASKPPENPRAEAIGAPPSFALPGIPMKNSESEATSSAARPSKKAAQNKAEEEKPAVYQPEAQESAQAPAQAAAQAPAQAAAPAAGGKDLEFHLNAAKRYSARRKYLSAAAEYRAAMGFMPPGDPAAVHALERQGAMTLRAGDLAKAGEYFSAAIKQAGDLGVANADVSNAHLGLGYCLEQKKDISGALDNYEKALKNASSKTVKARINDTIKNLKKGGN